MHNPKRDTVAHPAGDIATKPLSPGPQLCGADTLLPRCDLDSSKPLSPGPQLCGDHTLLPACEFDSDKLLPSLASFSQPSPTKLPPLPLASTLPRRAFFEEAPLLASVSSPSTIPHFTVKELLVGTGAGFGVLALILVVLGLMRLRKRKGQENDRRRSRKREQCAMEMGA